MRYGLFDLFPDVSSVGASGGTPQVTSSTTADVRPEEKKPIEVSVFSAYDANENSVVDYTEANNNSLFVERSTPESTEIIRDAHISSEAIEQIKQNALSKYNPAAKFTEILQSFSSETGSQTLKFNDGIEDSNQISQTRERLNTVARQEARDTSTRVNAEITRMYREALAEAQNEYNEQNKQDVEAYSSYDANKDKTVEYSEISHEFHGPNLSDMLASNMKTTDVSRNVIRQKAMAELGFNPSEKFVSDVSQFSESYDGSNQRQEEIDQQILGKANDFNRRVNSAIRQEYQQALDRVAANPEFTEQDFEYMIRQQEEYRLLYGRSQREPQKQSTCIVRSHSSSRPGALDEMVPMDNNRSVTSGLLRSYSGPEGAGPNMFNNFFTPVNTSDSSGSDNNKTVYKVKNGDTLERIAERYDTSVDNLIEINKNMRLEPDSHLRKGMKLMVPTRQA